MPSSKPDPQVPNKLLLVNLSRIWGGGEQWFFSVGKALRESGFDLIWWVYPDAPLAKRLAAEALPFETSPYRFLDMLIPGKLARLEAEIRAIGPDLVLLNASHELKTVGWAASRVGLKHIVFRRGVSYPLSSNALNRWFIRRHTTAFLGNAQATFDAFAAAFPIIQTRPHIFLNNGIDLRQWVPASAASSPFRIGMSARLSKEKGIDRALEAMALLVQRGHPIELWIMGEGPDRVLIERQIIELQLQKTVRLWGKVDDVAAKLQTCSLFLFTPRWGEGTSLALLEAMALELPCVVFDTAAMKEVVKDGQTGFVVPDGDVALLADRIEELLTHPAKAKNMGQAGRQRVEAEFSLASLADRLTDWIQNTLALPLDRNA